MIERRRFEEEQPNNKNEPFFQKKSLARWIEIQAKYFFWTG